MEEGPKKSDVQNQEDSAADAQYKKDSIHLMNNLVALLQQKGMIKEQIASTRDLKAMAELADAFTVVEQPIENHQSEILKASTCAQNVSASAPVPGQPSLPACSSGSLNPNVSVSMSTPRATSAASTPVPSPDQKKARTDADQDKEFDDNPMGRSPTTFDK